MASFLELALLSLAALLPIVYPFSTVPLFLAITEGQNAATRNEQGKKGVIYIVLVTLRLSGYLTRILRVSGVHAMTKIMGFPIFCIAIQFIVTGVTDPEIVSRFHDAWGAE